jgi:glycosyltransferase involved in cell wall biosynthesis
VRERLTGLTKAVIHDIDNPISPAFFDIVRHERPGTIFSAALISPRKNTLALVEAVGLLAARGIRAELRLAGEVVDHAYGEQVKALIARLRLEEQVMLLGRLSTAQVMEELASASVFALVSLEENSPMGIEEAMAAGVPVVTSNRCGMPYMVRDGETGFLVDPHTPSDIGQSLRRLLQSEERRGSCGQKSRRVAEDRFHPAVVAARTRDVYLRTTDSQ